MAGKYWIETLGCPKNQVDSEKLAGKFVSDGLIAADNAEDADVVVVNTCAFVEQARQESIDTILALDANRAPGSRLVVTGCMAERYGEELSDAMSEIDQVAGFGVPVTLGPTRSAPSFDLLNLPRPKSSVPWAYVKVAEGCDRACGFCAIPTFRGKQRSRQMDDILREVEQLDVREIVLVAQDLAAYGRDAGVGERAIVPLTKAVAEMVKRVRLLYLYPSDLTDELIETILGTDVPYFDLSLQHVSPTLLRRMRRYGDGEKFLSRIAAIRAQQPDAVFRSNFIVGYPGETEEDHDQLLEFVSEVELDWCGFFPFSNEDGTYAATLDGHVPSELVNERLRELSELQDRITAAKRHLLLGTTTEVLIDAPGVARSWREAPEIDGIISVSTELPVGQFFTVEITGAFGPDLEAEIVSPGRAQ